jgi:hypothetical protein
MSTQEQSQLVEKIVAHVADYRQQEIARVDRTRVLSWLHQFDQNDQQTILHETERILSKTYISRKIAKAFIQKLITAPDLAGTEPKEFWKAVGYLRLQTGSRSQTDMLELLDEVLAEKFCLTTKSQNSTNNTFVYLDDAVACTRFG